MKGMEKWKKGKGNMNEWNREIYYKHQADRHFPKRNNLQLVINNVELQRKKDIKSMQDEIQYYAKWLAYKEEE